MELPTPEKVTWSRILWDLAWSFVTEPIEFVRAFWDIFITRRDEHLEYRVPEGSLPSDLWIARASLYVFKHSPRAETAKGDIKDWRFVSAELTELYDISALCPPGDTKTLKLGISARFESMSIDQALVLSFIAVVEPVGPSRWGDAELAQTAVRGSNRVETLGGSS